jgi:8-oxo-dGTP pyrophosphatase MutT (NUDIX family)
MKEKIDKNLLETAVRETEEEIGVSVDSIKVLGDFHDYIAITDQLVRPYVGVIDGTAKFKANKQEVAYLLEVPISFFLEAVPTVKKREVRGVTHKVYYFDYNGDTIWGLTARIIKDFIDECLELQI